VRQEAALLRKWTDSPADLASWIAEADARRATTRRSRPSLGTLRFVRENEWTNEGDIARPDLLKLSAQHVR
jgi:hypothetical protein